jgi:chaperonin GroES
LLTVAATWPSEWEKRPVDLNVTSLIQKGLAASSARTAEYHSVKERSQMVLKLKPLADRLVVEPTEQEEMTASGIYVPETAKEKPQEGKVIAVGPGRKDDDGQRIAMDVAVGDRVLYARYAGTEVKLEDRKVLILKESDILAILE